MARASKPREPEPCPSLVPIYLRDAQPILREHDGDTDRAEATRVAAVKRLLALSRAERLEGQKRGEDTAPRADVAEFFAAEAWRISRLADPAAGFDLFVNGPPTRKGRPSGADPESFGAVDMVNARRKEKPSLSIDAACASVAEELGQTKEGMKKLYYRWRGERDAYRAKLRSDRERAERESRAMASMRSIDEAAPTDGDPFENWLSQTEAERPE
jgi:hypothetical protein